MPEPIGKGRSNSFSNSSGILDQDILGPGYARAPGSEREDAQVSS